MLSPENEEGNIEYKLKLLNVNQDRKQNLITQMRRRCIDGGGECIYILGVEDNGSMAGISGEESEETIRNITNIALENNYSISILSKKEILKNKFICEILIREKNENKYIDIKVAVAGNCDAGKSTLIGTLISGEKDNGRGLARSHVFVYPHELKTGRTSAISHQIIGYDHEGKIVNYQGLGKLSWQEIVQKSSKIISIMDLAGHEKYLHTTILGLASSFPDICMIIVDANNGIKPMTKEHILLCVTLKIPFTSDEAREINKEIFETIYFGSMSASVDLAKRDGYYPTYIGSPLSEGKFQYNLWGLKDVDLSGRWKWGELRNNLLKYGSRNSLNIALMPTASTASIFGNVESFEAITSNLYTRNVLSGVFTMINKYLIQDLIDLEIWNQDTKDRLIYNKGSVQNLKALPNFLREIYKTSFEIEQKLIIKMSAERGVFVCQSQSLNLFFDKPTFKDLTACHFYGWKNGLKTGSYYIRTRSALSGQNFGLDPKKEKQLREEKIDDIEDEGCLSCGA